MLETLNEDIFDKLELADTSAICVTTNCSIDPNGSNPMGALAGQAARRWKGLPKIYGKMLLVVPNVPCIIGWVPKKSPDIFLDLFDSTTNLGLYYSDAPSTAIVAFPTMHLITEPADINLIVRNAELLVEMANLFSWEKVYLGSPGTGVGGLSVSLVHDKLKSIFDDRFVVMRK